MAGVDIKLKNYQGVETTYNGIEQITIPDVNGTPQTFSLGGGGVTVSNYSPTCSVGELIGLNPNDFTDGYKGADVDCHVSLNGSGLFTYLMGDTVIASHIPDASDPDIESILLGLGLPSSFNACDPGDGLLITILANQSNHTGYVYDSSNLDIGIREISLGDVDSAPSIPIFAQYSKVLRIWATYSGCGTIDCGTILLSDEQLAGIHDYITIT